jgi:hypothetical protein
MKAEKKEKTIAYVIAVILGFVVGLIIYLIEILVDKVLGYSAGVAYFILVIVGGFIFFAICINKYLNEEEEKNLNYDETIKSMLKELKSKRIIGKENA